MPRVLFVCLGNICRSPLGEGILKRMVADRGLDIEVDSAGTGDYHIGDTAHPRSIKVGTERGCTMDMRARQLRSSDFQDFELIVVMDQNNYRDVLSWNGAVPDKVRLARSFDPNAAGDTVPDPYYGTLQDYEDVADMLEPACEGIIEALTTIDEPNVAGYS